MAKEDYKGIWVFAEQENGIIEPTVFELIAKSKDLQAYNKEEIVAVLLGSGIENLAQDLIIFSTSIGFVPSILTTVTSTYDKSEVFPKLTLTNSFALITSPAEYDELFLSL